MASSEYMILHPDQASMLSLLWFLVIDTDLSHSDFVETNVTTPQETSFSERLLIVGTVVYMKFASSISGYWDKLVGVIEFALNFISLNGGIFGLIWRSLTGSLVTPQPDDAAYRSIKSFISGPVNLDKKTAAMIKYVPLDDLEIGFQDVPMLELAIMASNLAYENKARIEDVVDNQWKMDFVQFYECWNIFLEACATEAFIFCDKATDAQLIVVAFRGTEGFKDCETDINFSWIDTKVMGKVHVGFMKALGLQDEKNFADGFPVDYSGSETLAYYSIRAELTQLVTNNSSAKILVTGHSLGGALATLFTSLLLYHDQQDILDKIQNVMTFGQPRVGNEDFGEYMLSKLGDRYSRMVYRFDLVPRIPFDLPVLMKYKHFGTCIEYEGRFKGTTGTEMPNKNYFNLLYWPLIYWGYLVDLALSIWWGITKGLWEGWWGTLYRLICIFLPGLIFHSCSNYIYAATYATVTHTDKIMG